MKNTIFKFSILATTLSVMLLASCKKNQCAPCHYEKNGAEIELGEKCGDDLENLEANGYNDSGTVYEVHCHEH